MEKGREVAVIFAVVKLSAVKIVQNAHRGKWDLPIKSKMKQFLQNLHLVLR